jgi:hypothetical protein
MARCMTAAPIDVWIGHSIDITVFHRYSRGAKPLTRSVMQAGRERPTKWPVLQGVPA